jgi:uncharacterized protein (TIGR03643 family)
MPKSPLKLTPELVNNIVRMAWEDRTTFEDIREKTGLRESEVIVVMRRELKPGSFRLWRKRVSGRVTKHRKMMMIKNHALVETES